MRTDFFILYAIMIFSAAGLQSQVELTRHQNKWGIRKDSVFIVQPVYDSIYAYDKTKRVCLACHKTRTASSGQFMKVMVTRHSCNYFNNKGERLFIKTSGDDTCSVFSLSKNSLNYQDGAEHFVVAVKNRKYLLTKDFTQRTFRDYQEIALTDDPMFYETQIMNEAEILLSGLVNQKEDVVVPHNYSGIKVNPADSLIIACSAGVRQNAEDDIFDYSGKKVGSSHRHIDMATRNFIIHKIYEPKEHYIFFNKETRQEVKIVAADLKYHKEDQVLIRIKNDWYIYDLQSNEKKLKNKS